MRRRNIRSGRRRVAIDPEKEERFKARLQAEKEARFRARAEQESTPARRSPMELLTRGAGFTARGVVEGAVALPALVLDPIQKAAGMQTLSGGVHNLLTRAGLPEKPETAAETIAEFGGGFAPGGAVSKLAKAPAFLADISKRLMASSLKMPKKMWRTGDAEEAIQTMLDRGFTVSKGSVDKMRGLVDDLNTRVQGEIANSTANIDKARMSQYYNDLVNKFKNQVNPNADLQAIRKSWQEFQQNPAWSGQGTMPVQKAQELKTGTYRQLRDKYGELGSAETEAQKTGARYLKDEINRVAPQVVPLVREEQELLNALKPTEQAMWRELNSNPTNLAWLSHNPASFVGYMADKSPQFKSLLAKYMYRTAGPVGAIAGGGVTATLGEIQRANERAPGGQ